MRSRARPAGCSPGSGLSTVPRRVADPGPGYTPVLERESREYATSCEKSKKSTQRLFKQGISPAKTEISGHRLFKHVFVYENREIGPRTFERVIFAEKTGFFGVGLRYRSWYPTPL